MRLMQTQGDLPLSLDLDNDPGTMTWSVGDVPR